MTRKSEQIKVLFATRIYWPDAHLMRTLVTRLAEAGIDVSILTQQPSYKKANFDQRYPAHEVDLGVKVRRMAVTPGARRFRLLVKLDMILFPFKLIIAMIARRLRGDQPDYLIVHTMPPVFMALAGNLVSRLTGTRLIYHFMDIYPELAGIYGMIRRDGLLYRVARYLDTLNIRMAYRCVVLSEEMADTLVQRGVSRDKMVIINNFIADAHGEEPATVPAEFARTPGIHRLIFAGNLGRFQHLDAVLEAARIVSEERDDIEIVFMGSGVKEPDVRAVAAASPGIHHYPHQSVDQANAIIAEASLGIISLNPDVYRYAFPSKTFTYMACGVPILAVIENDGELARIVEENGIGLCARDHSADAIAEAMVEAVDRGFLTEKIGGRVSEAYEARYRVDTVAAQWVSMFKDGSVG